MKIKPGEQLTSLFKIIEAAKNVGCYKIANTALGRFQTAKN